jgi:[ribosomal protein S5]-alanine N-acetyltransferase
MQLYVETNRLILRELTTTDAQGMFELDSDPEVHKYLGNKPITNIEECLKTIEMVKKQYHENGIGRFAMIEKSSGSFIGWSGIKYITEPINNHVNFYEVGYRIIQKYWGKGYATESTKASLYFAFNQLNAKEVYGITNVENLKSVRVLEKCGLKIIGHFIWNDWHEIQSNWLKITKQEWEEKNEFDRIRKL